MMQIDSLSALLTALGPIATAAFYAWSRRADARKTRQIDETSARVDQAAAHVAEVADQVKPNGGSSLRDAVDRIERGLDALTARVDVNRERIETIETRHQDQRRTWWRS
jgi:septal ring factor EnvC (AmiA/AmiB activator)